MDKKKDAIKKVPVEVTINILAMTKVERIVDKLFTYTKLGVQVIKFTGYIQRLADCPEALSMVYKKVSLFIDSPENCPNSIKRYIENAE